MVFGAKAFESAKISKPKKGKKNVGYLFPTLKPPAQHKQADSASSQPAVVKVAKESGRPLKIKARFFENTNETPKPTFETVGPYIFKVILIEEGMGNQVDGFYYTQEVLQASAPLFEGKKIYADHPDKLQEDIRPERTIRDIVGHYENVRCELDESNGLSCLYADAVTMPDESYRWARALMRHAVDYSSKYPDKLFIGLSINAGGDATQMNIKEFLASGKVKDAAKPKVQAAIENGAETIRVVNQIQSVVSTDLVTEPGAGGRVLAILESEKGKEMKQKKEAKHHEEADHEKEGMHHEEEGAADKGKKPMPPEAKKPDPKDGHADGAGADGKDGTDGADDTHDDEGKDRELIAQMLKKALGSDVDVSEDAIMAAKEAYEGYKEMGYKEEDAMQHASHSMKLAHHMAGKASEKAAKEAEAKDHEEALPPKKDAAPAHDDDGDDDGDAPAPKQKESAKILRLEGEVAKLKEGMARRELVDYIDSKLASTKLDRKVTGRIREATKGARNKTDFDRYLQCFMEGYKQAEAEVSQPTSLLFLEKEDTVNAETAGSAMSLTDCVKEY